MTILSSRVATEIDILSKYDGDAAKAAMLIEKIVGENVSDTDPNINAEDALLYLVYKMIELSRENMRHASRLDASTSKEYRVRDL